MITALNIAFHPLPPWMISYTPSVQTYKFTYSERKPTNIIIFFTSNYTKFESKFWLKRFWTEDLYFKFIFSRLYLKLLDTEKKEKLYI